MFNFERLDYPRATHLRQARYHLLNLAQASSAVARGDCRQHAKDGYVVVAQRYFPGGRERKPRGCV
jgi:hypothetical protein